MVHALQQAGSLLKPSGVIISIQAHPSPAVIRIHNNHATRNLGWLGDNTDFSGERAGMQALLQMVSAEILTLEDEVDYEYVIQMDSLVDLNTLLTEYWDSAILPERTRDQIENCFLERTDPQKIEVVVPARMTVLSRTIRSVLK